MTKITAESIKALIAQKYSESKFVTFFELRSSTGGAMGSIDAFVMNVWPSSKFPRYAFEIKVSRADLMHELKRPDKRQWSFDMSNEFWFVCAAGICKPDEIPQNCGLMVVSKNGQMLRVMKRAQWREAQPLKERQIAAIIRAASRMQKYPETLIWLRAGEEIDMNELDVIVRSRRDDVDNDDIDKKAKAIARDMLQSQNSDMARYAEAMREAGIEPPDFMLGKSTGYLYDYTVTEWVQENLVSGADGRELLTAVRELKTVDIALKSARDAIIRLTVRKKDNGDQEELPGT